MKIFRRINGRNVDITLTAQELNTAYHEQKLAYDEDEIKNAIDTRYDELNDIYNLDDRPVTHDEILAMTYFLHWRVDMEADIIRSVYVKTAITEILDKRK